VTQQEIRVRRDMVRHPHYPERWVSIPFERRFTASEYERISLGSLPSGDLNGVWLSYVEADTLFIHRWTGRCIYKLHFQSQGDEFVVSGAFVARYPSPPIPGGGSGRTTRTDPPAVQTRPWLGTWTSSR
jgi:hypothetical protein